MSVDNNLFHRLVVVVMTVVLCSCYRNGTVKFQHDESVVVKTSEAQTFVYEVVTSAGTGSLIMHTGDSLSLQFSETRSIKKFVLAYEPRYNPI